MEWVAILIIFIAGTVVGVIGTALWIGRGMWR
jgi:hypothetical protein